MVFFALKHSKCAEKKLQNNNKQELNNNWLIKIQKDSNKKWEHYKVHINGNIPQVIFNIVKPFRL